MQHKALLTALFCGALCLTGCIKNVESDSVTQIRNAKAQELLSVAELNKATAQATVTAANAEAALKAAQAQLTQAQAQIAAAQAALIQAQAELQLIENQIALVKLEEEKVVLQQKKAELQKLIAEYEAAIAEADAAKQEALNRLANAKAQAEIDALVKAQELLQAQAALDAEADQELRTAYTNYENAMTELYDALARITEAQVEATQLENGIIDGLTVKANKIADLQADIVYYQAVIEYLESFKNLDGENIDDKWDTAYSAYYAALTAEKQALETATAAGEAFTKLNNQNMAYEANWDEEFVEFVEYEYRSVSKQFSGGWKRNDNYDWEYGLYYYDEAGSMLPKTFVPLYSDYEITSVHPSMHSLSHGNADYELYPAPVDGVMPAYYAGFYKETTFVPAKIYFDNFAPYFEAVVADAKVKAEKQKEILKATKDSKDAHIASKIEELTGTVAAYTEYVAKADEEIKPAEQAVEAAKEKQKEAKIALNDAQKAYDEYLASQTSDPTDQAKAERDAFQIVVSAGTNLANGIDKKAAAQEKVNSLKEDIKSLTDDKFEADLEEAKAHNAFNVADKKVTAEIEQAVTDAKKAVTDQESVVAGKEKAEAEALAKYRAAQIKYAANPNESNQTAMSDAEDLWKAAVEETNTEKGKLPALNTKLQEAQEAYDKVKGPADEAKQKWDEAKAAATTAANNLTKANNALGKEDDSPSIAEDATAYAKLNYWTKEVGEAEDAATGTTLYAKFNDAVAKWEDARDANPDDSEEYVLLYTALQNATAEMTAADGVVKTATSELESIMNKYPKYLGYLANIDPENKTLYYDSEHDSVLDKDVPKQKLAQIAGYQALSVDLQKEHESDIAAEDKKVADLQEWIARIQASLDNYKALEEGYLAYGEQVVAAYKVWEKASKDYLDAQNATVAAEAAYKAIDAIYNKTIEVVDYDPDTDEWETITINDVDDYISFIQFLIADAEAEIAELMADIDKYYVNDKLNIEALADLEAEIESLNVKIEVYTALAEKYAAQIAALLGTEDAVE